MNKRVSIISDDCWSYFVHKELGLEHLTPFYDIKILPEDYLNLVKNFFTIDFDNIKYLGEGEETSDRSYYPKVLLDDSIILHPIHCFSFYEFKKKWLRRAERINFHNLVFKFTNHSGDAELDALFTSLVPNDRKILYTERDLSNVQFDTTLVRTVRRWDKFEIDDQFKSSDSELIDFIHGDGTY